MKLESAQKKGKKFEKLVAKEVEAEGLGIARREAGSGSGLRKGDIAASLPFLLECKNQNISIKVFLGWIDQAKRQAEIGNWSLEKWALIFKDPRSTEANPEIYAVIDFWEFLKLLKRYSEPRIKKPDRKLKYDLEDLKRQCQRVIKQIK